VPLKLRPYGTIQIHLLLYYCHHYRGIKLLKHAMKLVKRVFEYRIQQQIEIDDMQFGFER